MSAKRIAATVAAGAILAFVASAGTPASGRASNLSLSPRTGAPAAATTTTAASSTDGSGTSASGSTSEGTTTANEATPAATPVPGNPNLTG